MLYVLIVCSTLLAGGPSCAAVGYTLTAKECEAERMALPLVPGVVVSCARRVTL
jgi:hypothetical protein